MARGIEHKSVDGVIDAYILNDHPNWGLFSGREIMIAYEDGNMDAGMSMLKDYLDILQQGGSSAVYTLRIYNDDVKNITDKTGYRASTTCMLNSNTATRTENGVTIIDRGVGNTAAPGNNAASALIMARLDKLETENARLRDENHKQEIKFLMDKLDKAIAGTEAKEEKKPWWENLIEKVSERPESIGKFLEPIKDLFVEKKNYIVQTVPQTVPVAGTDNKEEPPMSNTQATAGPLQNPFITDEERKMSSDEQSKLLIDRLAKLTDEEHEDVQNECLESIAARISHVTLTRMLLAVADMDDKNMNKLLNHLD